MRVLLVHNKYKENGGEDMIFHHEYNLLQDFIDVDSIVFDNEGVRVSQVLYNKESSNLLQKKIDSFKPELVHIHNLFYKASPGIINTIERNGIPIVLTLHNYRLLCSGALLQRSNSVCKLCVNKKLPLYPAIFGCFKQSRIKSSILTTVIGVHKYLKTWNKVNKFITLTNFSKELYIESSLDLNQDQIIVKPNSVNDFGFAKKDDRSNYYLYIGRVSKEKGVDVLVDAFNMLDEKLEIIGDGPLMKEIEVKSHSNIKLHGFKDSVFIKNRLKNCKALIVPSIWYEGLPTTILESFSTGTPVICSDIDNLNTIISNGENGSLFKTGDSESLCLKVLEFEKLNTSSMYTNARNTFLRKYSHEKNIKSLLSIYNGLLNG